MINLTTAGISDSADAQKILDQIRKRRPWVKHLSADGARDHRTLMDKAAYKDFVIEIMRQNEPSARVFPHLSYDPNPQGNRFRLTAP